MPKSQLIFVDTVHDSSAKMPSGLLNGNVNAFGDFWQCVRISREIEGTIEEGGGRLVGKYCMVEAFIEIEQPEKVHPNIHRIWDLVVSHRMIHNSYFDVSRYNNVIQRSINLSIYLYQCQYLFFYIHA